MFKSNAVLLASLLLVAVAWFTQSAGHVRAQEDDVTLDVAASQPVLTVVVYPDGRTGFFDQATRTIFIYDQALRRCNTIRTIETLGDELDRVRN